MKTYHININDNDFYLKLSELTPRFENEGEHQKVIITLNDGVLYYSEWGLSSFIASLYSDESMMGKIQYRDNNIYYIKSYDDQNAYSAKLDSADSKKFMKWLSFCNLPVVDQRKIKLKQWKEKQSGL